MEKQKKKKSEEEELLSYDYGAGICDDLLPDILCKLPVMSLCRFKCASKFWQALFQEPKFINRTRSNFPFELEIQHDRFLEYFWVDESGLVTSKRGLQRIDLGEKGSSYRRCNSFICYQSQNNKIVLIDLSIPTTTYNLPPLPAKYSMRERFSFEFGFDPCSKQYKVLLWKQVSRTWDFHIITLLMSEGEGEAGPESKYLKLLSSWRPLGGIPPISGSCKKSLVTTTGMIYFFDGVHFISFNLASEEFETIVEPPCKIQPPKSRIEIWDPSDPLWSIYKPEYMPKPNLIQSKFSYSLFEYEGCLCWVELSLFAEPTGFRHWAIVGMWMLRDVHPHNNVWVRLMNKTHLPTGCPVGSRSWTEKHSHFSSTRNGEIMIVTSNHHFAPCLLLYSFLDHQFRPTKFSMEPSILMNIRSEGNASCREL